MKLSILIPARNEELTIQATVESVIRTLEQEKIDHEVIIINDGSSDSTESILKAICASHQNVRYLNNIHPFGFGLAIRYGLRSFSGDAVVIVMGDGSDDPKDIVRYFRKLEEGFECVFGTRFSRESKVTDYPVHKLVLNRFANFFIKILFGLKYNDVTNAFKCYRRNVVQGIEPLFANHFNLTVEMPLKAIIRGYSYAVIPISWTNRKFGLSKLKIKEMGSRYLFIVLYLFFEKTLSCGDYLRQDKKP